MGTGGQGPTQAEGGGNWWSGSNTGRLRWELVVRVQHRQREVGTGGQGPHFEAIVALPYRKTVLL